MTTKPSKTDWQSVRDGVWVDGVMNSIHLHDPRGGKKLYARRDVGTKAPVWYDSLREAKAGKADDPNDTPVPRVRRKSPRKVRSTRRSAA